jgi:hypothetical protein
LLVAGLHDVVGGLDTSDAADGFLLVTGVDETFFGLFATIAEDFLLLAADAVVFFGLATDAFLLSVADFVVTLFGFLATTFFGFGGISSSSRHASFAFFTVVVTRFVPFLGVVTASPQLTFRQPRTVSVLGAGFFFLTSVFLGARTFFCAYFWAAMAALAATLRASKARRAARVLTRAEEARRITMVALVFAISMYSQDRRVLIGAMVEMCVLRRVGN